MNKIMVWVKCPDIITNCDGCSKCINGLENACDGTFNTELTQPLETIPEVNAMLKEERESYNELVERQQARISELKLRIIDHFMLETNAEKQELHDLKAEFVDDLTELGMVLCEEGNFVRDNINNLISKWKEKTSTMEILPESKAEGEVYNLTDGQPLNVGGQANEKQT